MSDGAKTNTPPKIDTPQILHNKGHFTHETWAHDHCISSTLIGGKGGASPNLLYTTLEGPME
jgi:hypothetical protein